LRCASAANRCNRRRANRRQEEDQNGRLVAVTNHVYACEKAERPTRANWINELEVFFVNYHGLEEKDRLLGCKGADAAMKLIKQSKEKQLGATSMSEMAARFFVGGLVVSLCAMFSDALRPKSFGSLFGAAPSIALATLGFTIHKNGRVVAALEACSMMLGVIVPWYMR
jgi:hypothetical protein